jgi:hypothetical protein
MTGRKPDRASYWNGVRERQAKEIEQSDRCIARSTYDLEIGLPCQRVSQALGRPGQLSSLQMEKSWRLFLREWGEPADPIEYELLFTFFLARHKGHAVWDVMSGEGSPGFKAMGALHTRMQRDLVALGETLQEMRRRRLEAGENDAGDDDGVDAEEAEERVEEEFRRERQRDYDEARAMEVKEAAQILVDLPADERDALLRAEEDRRADSRRELERLGIKSPDDVKKFVTNSGPPPTKPEPAKPSESPADLPTLGGPGSPSSPPAGTILGEASKADPDERFEAERRRTEEAIKHVRPSPRPAPDSPTADGRPRADDSPIDRTKRQSEIDQQRFERIDRVMRARAAQPTIAAEGVTNV